MTDDPNSDPVEYDCVDCGRHVISWGRIGPDLIHCSTCYWIRQTIAPEDRDKVRATLGCTPAAPEVRDITDLDLVFLREPKCPTG